MYLSVNTRLQDFYPKEKDCGIAILFQIHAVVSITLGSATA
jgi:hypothetical protein